MMKVSDPYFRWERIRKYVDEDIAPARIRRYFELRDWQYAEWAMEDPLLPHSVEGVDFTKGEPFQLGNSWGGYDKVAWFSCEADIPSLGEQEVLAFKARVGPRDGGGSTAESLLYVNQEVVQGIDVWHEEAWLDPRLYAGQTKLKIALKAWSGVLDIPAQRVFREGALVVIDRETDRFYHLVDTLLGCIKELKEEDLRRIRLLQLLVDSFALVNFLEIGSETFYQSIRQALALLENKLAELEQIEEIKPSLSGIGHSHLDMGWLWRYQATREKASRTFATVLNLMRQHPEYVFLHTSPQLYKFLAKDYPQLYEQIKAKVAEGRWEVTGGMWVEPDTNLPSGESLIRQFLLGKRFIKQEFNQDSQLTWLPDVFGYSAALPQIMVKSGMKYFMTTKISWNQYNHFPHDTFWWKGLDGSKILTHFITTPEDGSWFYTYNGRMTPEEVTGIWTNYKDKDKNEDLLMSYGWGDGGGGPTAEMIKRAVCMKNVPGIPKVRLEKAEKYFERLLQRVSKEKLAEWSGELYFEYHRGTYTSQGRTKRNNRLAEMLLHDLEFLSVYNDVLAQSQSYPQSLLEEYWEAVLLNQFHDVLPGSSIEQVYADTDRIYWYWQQKGQDLLEKGLEKLANLLRLTSTQGLVLNTTGWERSELILLPKVSGKEPTVSYQQGGESLPSQVTTDGVLLLVKAIPGYGVSIIEKAKEATPSELAGADGLSFRQTETFTESDRCFVSSQRMENAFYTLQFSEDGSIASLYDKRAQREVGDSSPMNQFVAYEDKPQRFDAWDIDIYYREKPYPAPQLLQSEVVARGPLLMAIKQRYSFHNSTIEQETRMYSHSPRIDFVTRVDWQERQVLLKVYFPLAIHSEFATYEIQCGNLERPTHENTEWDLARFEVCGQRWVDLSEKDYGVALLNDCKYGHDVRDNVLGLTLIKSAIRPDPQADLGEHYFSYSLLPHLGDCMQGEVQKEAMCFNHKLHSFALSHKESIPLEEEGGDYDDSLGTEALVRAESLNSAQAFCCLDSDHIVLDTWKAAESGDGYIVRLYEYQNRRSRRVCLKTLKRIAQVWETDLMEQPLTLLESQENSMYFDINPYEIKTFKLCFCQ